MKVYVVLRWDVYIQGVVGVYSDFEGAAAAGLIAKAAEPDGYHTFVIRELELDAPARERVRDDT